MHARNIRGIQLGRHNLQLNHFEYRVQKPVVNFTAVLQQARLRDRLALLATDPENAGLRAEIDRILARRPLLGRSSLVDVERRRTRRSQSTSSSTAFSTLVLVYDSEGMQIGEGGRQENHFLYVVAPTYDAAGLLASDEELRAELIETVCPSVPDNASGVALRERLATTLEAALLQQPGLRTTGDRIDLEKRRDVRIADRDGVSIGIDSRQENDVSVAVIIGGPGVRLPVAPPVVPPRSGPEPGPAPGTPARPELGAGRARTGSGEALQAPRPQPAPPGGSPDAGRRRASQRTTIAPAGSGRNRDDGAPRTTQPGGPTQLRPDEVVDAFRWSLVAGATYRRLADAVTTAFPSSSYVVSRLGWDPDRYLDQMRVVLSTLPAAEMGMWRPPVQAVVAEIDRVRSQAGAERAP